MPYLGCTRGRSYEKSGCGKRSVHGIQPRHCGLFLIVSLFLRRVMGGGVLSGVQDKLRRKQLAAERTRERMKSRQARAMQVLELYYNCGRVYQ